MGTLTPEMAAAIAKIDAAMEKLRATSPGDFAAYGAALAELDAALKEFDAAQAAAGARHPAAGDPVPDPEPDRLAPVSGPRVDQGVTRRLVDL